LVPPDPAGWPKWSRNRPGCKSCRDGSIDEATWALTFSATDDAASYGVVDEIARRGWLSGGRVLAVRRDDVPGKNSVAAVLRYPL